MNSYTTHLAVVTAACEGLSVLRAMLSSSWAALEARTVLGEEDERLSSIAALLLSSMAGKLTGASRTKTPSGVRWDVIASGSTFAILRREENQKLHDENVLSGVILRFHGCPHQDLEFFLKLKKTCSQVTTTVSVAKENSSFTPR